MSSLVRNSVTFQWFDAAGWWQEGHSACYCHTNSWKFTFGNRPNLLWLQKKVDKQFRPLGEASKAPPWVSCLRGPHANAGKNGNGLLRKNINLLTDALSPYKEVKPTQLSGKLVKLLPPNVNCKDKMHQVWFPCCGSLQHSPKRTSCI